MDPQDLVADLDDDFWRALHPSGSNRVAVWLREIADPRGRADDIVRGGSGYVLNEGSVNAATAHAVPFLAKFIGAGIGVRPLVRLMGRIAEAGRGSLRREDRAAYEAVRRELPSAVRQACEGAEEARRTLFSEIRRLDDPGLAVPALRELWDIERDPAIRVRILQSRSHFDLADAAEAALPVVAGAETGAIQAVAVSVLVAAGAPCTPGLADVLVHSYSKFPVGREDHTEETFLGGSWGHREETDPLRSVVESLSLRGEWKVACDLVEAALRFQGRCFHHIRAMAFQSAEDLCSTFRSAPPRLMPALVALLSDRALAEDAERLLARLGASSDSSREVLAADDRPQDSFRVAKARYTATGEVEPLLEEIAKALTGRKEPDLFEEDWPELSPELQACYDALGVVAVPDYDVLPPEPPVEDEMLSGPSEEDWLHEDEGWPDDDFGDDDDGAEHEDRCDGSCDDDCDGWQSGTTLAAAASAELRDKALPILPVLLETLGRTFGGNLHRDLHLATAIWRVTGEAGRILPVLDAVLSDSGSPWRAYELAGEMGPAAAPLGFRLVRDLHRRRHVPGAVLALIRIYPHGGFPYGCTMSFFIDLLLECAEQGEGAQSALSVLNEIGLLHFSLPALDRLRALAYQQQRVHLDWDEFGPDIAADEALRQAAHELLTAG